MSGRVILCGSVSLSEAAFKKAQALPFMELCTVDPDDPDEESFLFKQASATTLFSPDADPKHGKWASNRYDAAEKRWVFGCSLHDDDWWNGNSEPLAESLLAVKDDAEEVDVAIAFTEDTRSLAAAWIIRRGKVTEIEESDFPELPGAIAKLLA